MPIDATDQSFHTSWSCCLNVLKYYRLQILPAAKAIAILENLKGKVQFITRLTPASEASLGVSGSSVNILAQVETNSENIDNRISGESRETVLGREGLDMSTMDSINDAWFTQQLSDMNWLDFS